MVATMISRMVGTLCFQIGRSFRYSQPAPAAISTLQSGQSRLNVCPTNCAMLAPIWTLGPSLPNASPEPIASNPPKNFRESRGMVRRGAPLRAPPQPEECHSQTRKVRTAYHPRSKSGSGSTSSDNNEHAGHVRPVPPEYGCIAQMIRPLERYPENRPQKPGRHAHDWRQESTASRTAAKVRYYHRHYRADLRCSVAMSGVR